MMTRIAAIATLMFVAAGCLEAESHEPMSPNGNDQAGTLSPVGVTESQLIGRWENAAGEIHDLLAGGTWVHTPATVLRASGTTTGTWHLQDFGGEQYLVTVAGGTGAQRVVNVTPDAIELQPGGVYDLVATAPAILDCVMPQGTHMIAHHCYNRAGFDECLAETNEGAPISAVAGCHPFGHVETCVADCDAADSADGL